ncbi:hypothetical protein EST92_16430 [Streptomyces sp. TM32]|uniref:hypothetical protein n=1 Tax=Streptomyces sp. TM32 TaxID=1652669 RepID=UPI0010121149|nr:hypothetical protein [Streptomyces sp. TM32]RXS81145.1 hypothetical protein EST92_16430 [Streptomyces sp. TM32]
MPAVEAAAGAYGVGVLTRAEDEAAEATVRLGQRLLARILHRGPDSASVEATVTSLADAGADQDILALRRAELRIALRDALRDSPSLADELSALLPERPTVQASGERSVAVGGNNSGVISTGDGAQNTGHP